MEHHEYHHQFWSSFIPVSISQLQPLLQQSVLGGPVCPKDKDSPDQVDFHAGHMRVIFWSSEGTDTGLDGYLVPRPAAVEGVLVPLFIVVNVGHGWTFEALTSDKLLFQSGLLQQGVVRHLQSPHFLLNLLDPIL